MTNITPDTAFQDTTVLYESIPEYIQEWDAGNNYQLFSWLNGACSMLQPLDNWARDNGDNQGIGWSLLFDYYYYYSGTLNGRHCTGLKDMRDVIQAFSTLPWLAQFVGVRLPQIPYEVLTVDESIFVQIVQPYINDWVERIVLINAFERGTVNSFLTFLSKFFINQNGYNNNTVYLANPTSTAGSGLTSGSITYSYSLAYGSMVIGDYLDTYGFSDKNFNGTNLLITAINTGAQTITVKSEDVKTGSLTDTGFGTQSVLPVDLLILEQTNVVYTPSVQYVYDPYAVVMLISSKYFLPNSYSSIFTSSNPYSYYISLYAAYSEYPNTVETIKPYINITLPGGLVCTVLSV